MAKKTKFKLPVLHKDKNTNTAIFVLIALAVIFIIYKLFKEFRPETETAIEQSNGGTTPNTPAPPKVNAITNATVFSLKNPRMKADRVQWMQNGYNKYARARKAKGKTPDWAVISEDSVFGPGTEAAMNRLMGKKSANWNEVKARSTYLTTELNKTATWNNSSSGGNW